MGEKVLLRLQNNKVIIKPHVTCPILPKEMKLSEWEPEPVLRSNSI